MVDVNHMRHMDDQKESEVEGSVDQNDGRLNSPTWTLHPRRG